MLGAYQDPSRNSDASLIELAPFQNLPFVKTRGAAHRWPDSYAPGQINPMYASIDMLRTARRNPPHRDFVAPLSVTLCGLLAVSGAFAQPREDHSHFEVASIRPVDGKVPLGYTGPATGDLGRIIISRTTLREVIAGAYPEYGQFGERISGPMA